MRETKFPRFVYYWLWLQFGILFQRNWPAGVFKEIKVLTCQKGGGFSVWDLSSPPVARSACGDSTDSNERDVAAGCLDRTRTMEVPYAAWSSPSLVSRLSANTTERLHPGKWQNQPGFQTIRYLHYTKVLNSDIFGRFPSAGRRQKPLSPWVFWWYCCWVYRTNLFQNSFQSSKITFFTCCPRGSLIKTS